MTLTACRDQRGDPFLSLMIHVRSFLDEEFGYVLMTLTACQDQRGVSMVILSFNVCSSFDKESGHI